MNKFTNIIVATFVASAPFASVALASDGEYYEGTAQATQSIDNITTHGISASRHHAGHGVAKAVSSGDYYEGAQRPE